MLYRADRRREGTGRRSLSLFLWIVFLTLLLLVLDEIGMLTPVKGQFLHVLAPAQRGLAVVRMQLHRAWDSIGGADALQAENEALRQRISALETENLRLQALEAENRQLRRSLQLKEQFRWRTMAASVLSLSADADRKAIFIDRGKEDGLAVGMVVIGQEGASPIAMVGVIDEIYPHNARVLLITDYRSILSARILHRERDAAGVEQIMVADGEIQGRWQLGSWLLMEKIDRHARIAEGDAVVTAGLSRQLDIDTPLARIPAGVPIGTIQAVRSSGRTPEVEVRPYLNPDRVQDVWVIVDSD